jgi:hypothetical protein
MAAFENDENYRIVDAAGEGGPVRIRTTAVSSAGVLYARTTNWSTTDVATGGAKETVDFTLAPGITPGDYLLEVIGAGISSMPWRIHIKQAQINGL